MKNFGRLSLILILLGLLFFLGILFRAFLLDNLVRPVAVLFWFLLRILSSVDQVYYWGTLVFATLGYVFYSLFLRRPKRPAVFEQTPPSRANATLENVHYWRTTILVTLDEIGKPNILKHNLGKMLASIYVSKEPGSSSLEVYKALRLINRPLPEQMTSELHRISLPEGMYAFLFPEESPARAADSAWSGNFFGKVFHTIWQTPRNLMRKWTGRDVADYYKSIEEVVALMESSMEINHDQKTIDTPDH
jgi:hypothetical protein